MEAHSLRRSNPRIFKSVRRVSKAALLSLVFLFIFIGNVSSVFADDTYATYLRLFKNPSGAPVNVKIGPNSSTFTSNGWALDKDSKKVLGPRFKFHFEFPASGLPGDYNPAYTWDHISAPGGTYPDFVLRTCDIGTEPGGITESTCLYSEVPYKEDASSMTSWFQDFYNWGTAAQGNISNLQLQNALNDINTTTNSLVIFRKDTNGNYVKAATQDVLGVDWFKFSSVAATIPVDWLQRPDQIVSLWYLADKINGNGTASNTPSNLVDSLDPDQAPDDGTDTVKKWLSDTSTKNSYFKIGEVKITKPASYEAAAAISNDQALNPNRDIQKSSLPECSMTNGTFGTGSFMGCIARLVYYVIYWPIAWFAGLMGSLFDFFLGYSLSDLSYRADFAVRGWQLVRDISNIFFIIILVWTGLSTVFGGKANMKQVIPNLILNALLINFSLFATRVIIDISNVTARVFYKSVQVCDGQCKPRDAEGNIPNAKLGITGYTPLSEKIVSSFNPQKIFSSQILNQSTALPGAAADSAQATTEADTSSSDYAGYFIVVSLIAAFILFAVAMMFWKTAFFFLGRVIGLYVAMIFAPFAFLSRGNMPIVSNIKELSWDSWFKDLTNYALLAPIFVFFLYIIYSFLDSDFISGFTTKSTGTSFIETVIYIAIPMLIVYVMINQGVKIAKKYAGAIGEAVQAGAMKVIGAGAGVALGGAAFAGRNIVGRGLKMYGNTKTSYTNEKGEKVETTRAAQWAANSNNNFFARKWNNTYSATQTGSWDARNLSAKIGGKQYSAGDTLNKGLGLTDSVSGVLGIGKDKALGKDGKPGGNVAIDKKRAENRAADLEKRINTSHLNDDEAKAAGTKYKDKKAQQAAEKNWEKHVGEEAAVKQAAATVTQAKEVVAQAQANLTTAEGGGNPANISAARLALQRAQNGEQTAQLNLTDISTQTVESLKRDSAYKNSAAYKAAVAAELKSLSKYNVKDGASFTSMMRAEYVENLKKQSFFRRMLDEVTSGSNIGATLIGGTIAALIPPLAPAIGAILSGVFATAIADTLGDPNKKNSITGRAVGAITKKATQKSGTGNVLVDMEERLGKYKDTLLASVNKMRADKNQSQFTSYEDLGDEDTVEDLIIQRTAHLEEQRDKFERDTTNTALSDMEREQARINKARTVRDINKLKNIQKDISEQQEKIDRHKEQKKKDEENKNKKSDGEEPKSK